MTGSMGKKTLVFLSVAITLLLLMSPSVPQRVKNPIGALSMVACLLVPILLIWAVCKTVRGTAQMVGQVVTKASVPLRREFACASPEKKIRMLRAQRVFIAVGSAILAIVATVFLTPIGGIITAYVCYRYGRLFWKESDAPIEFIKTQRIDS